MLYKYYDILLPLPFDECFTYKTKDDFIIGDIVQIPFRKKKLFGIIWQESKNYYQIKEEKIKEIIGKKNITLSQNIIDFISQISDYNLAKKGLILKPFINIINIDKRKKISDEALIQKVLPNLFNLKTLSINQQKIADSILHNIKKNCYDVSLIDAVTGSGKTEIYFNIIAEILKIKDSQILILLPEINLTTQLLSRFYESFGFDAALWHSKISTKEKRNIFYGIISGTTRIVIGARSALFLPFKNLKLIIIDEEHDSSFKQEDIINFNARDMAILKAKIDNIAVILSSATPSIETYYNSKIGEYNYFLLEEKFNQKKSKITVIDLKKNLKKNENITEILKTEIIKNFNDGQQTLLFLNRRGYAPVSLCKSCGEKIYCPNCSSYLVYHKNLAKAICHYCGHNQAFSPNCNFCKTQDSIINVGSGVEKIKEEVEKILPEARIAIITSDSVKNFDMAKKIIDDILTKKIDIIIGTQIIAKGYDFPHLSLVCVVDCDSGFYAAELKSAEKSFQLLSQVIGRAGRREYSGKIFLQTFSPENFILQKIITGDKKGFFDFEIENRKQADLPPFSKMASFIIGDFDEKNALNISRKFIRSFPVDDRIEIFGPAKMPIEKIKNYYYFRIFVKFHKKINLQKLIINVINNCHFLKKVKFKIDIDP